MRRPITPRQDEGFTAIEIAMVASVIAIIALLILPLFRSRSEEAKVVAAKDELQSLAKALLIAEADTGHLFRLQDLDNGITGSGAGGVIRPDIDVPIVWSGLDPTLPNIPWVTLTDVQRTKLIPPSGGGAVLVGTSYWRGPYLAFQKSVSFGQMRIANSLLFIDAGGPIYTVLGARGFPSPGGGLIDSDADRIPTDPWGSPYIFINLSETGYGPRLLYSMGPDGLPGTGVPPISGASYHSNRTGGQLGNGDDLEYIF